MIDRSKYKYIYNVKFANFLMLNGILCRGTGVSQSTGKFFWCFDYDECQPIYQEIEQQKNN